MAIKGVSDTEHEMMQVKVIYVESEVQRPFMERFTEWTTQLKKKDSK